MTTDVKIEQIDREAQAQLYANIGKPGMAEEIRAGQQDDHPGVQAFARHRLAERAAIVTWLRDTAECTSSAVAIGASLQRADAFCWCSDAIEQGRHHDD